MGGATYRLNPDQVEAVLPSFGPMSDAHEHRLMGTRRQFTSVREAIDWLAESLNGRFLSDTKIVQTFRIESSAS